MNWSDYLTPLEAAIRAGCARSYIYDQVSNGTLETRAIAGRRFISKKSFEKWLELYEIRRHVRRDVSPAGPVATAQAVA